MVNKSQRKYPGLILLWDLALKYSYLGAMPSTTSKAENMYSASMSDYSKIIYHSASSQNYKLQKKKGFEEDVAIDEYIRDIFENSYSDCLLNFGINDLLQSLSE
ncbi:hypothetical protein LPB86_06760 [Pedobacter sp. MC2016-14]|uniref:hypothetical protein n=1 Tax=Pedobacter sp. MC2016-14 TaxID=2897327 RepID=UPI001E5BA82B|nr:hypothetical protein [Pedobacter sp. MC2016-14]MCD0487922.1 hypothetical protein [Pedobacter sp. MC2016-14]